MDKSIIMKIGEIGDYYPLNENYWLFRKIVLPNVARRPNHELRCYGPYRDTRTVRGKEETFDGMKETKDWEEVVRLYEPDSRIFAKLPARPEDLPRKIEGEKPYIFLVKYDIEKDEKPLDGTSDYYRGYNFVNLGEQDARRVIKQLIKAGCEPERFPIGLELKVSKLELGERARAKEDALKKEVDKFF